MLSDVGACPSTLNALRAASLPCRTSRVPFGYLRANHGWLKNVAFIIPVSSATTASTSGFIPARRTGRLPIERTSTTTVAPSPAVSVATVRASRRSRGRCSSRSPTVKSPSEAAASAAFCGETLSGRASADGRAHRSGAASSWSCSSSSGVANAVGTRSMMIGAPDPDDPGHAPDPNGPARAIDPDGPARAPDP